MTVPDYSQLLRRTRGPGLKGGERRAARRHLAQVIRETVGADQLVEALLRIATDPLESGMVRLAAIRVLLDRGWGRPAQTLHVEAGIAEAVDEEASERALEEVDDAELVAAIDLADMVAARVGLAPGPGS